jgi:4-amino-4-deoxy-L-arabinose transferase-like glycosyltransferase
MQKSLLLVIIAALSLSLFRLGNAKLFDVDEAVFSEATREMVADHDWITPTYNGINRYDKPILFYWLMAGSYELFGVNEFAARLPSALAAVMLAAALFCFSARAGGGRDKGYSALSAVLSVYFLVYSRAAVTDMALTLFISLSLFSFYLFSEQGGKRLYSYGFYLFSALAFLTKGLIGIVFPFGIALLYMSITEGRRGLKKIFSLWGTLLFLAVAAPWYLAQLRINGWEFVDQFFIKHHFKRFTDVISGHRGPIYYYVPVMIAGLFPWVAFLPAGIKGALKERKGAALYSLIWLGCIFLFFSLSTTKLPNYVLPAMPAAALLIGMGMTEAEGNWRRYSLVASGVLAVVLGAAFLVAKDRIPVSVAPDAGWLLPLAAIALIIAGICFISAFSLRIHYGKIALLMAAFLFLLLMKGLPLASDYLQGALYRYSIFAKENLRPDEKLIVFGLNRPSIAFYSARSILAADDKKDLMSLPETKTHSVAITRTEDIGLFQGLGYNLVDHDSQYAILERK